MAAVNALNLATSVPSSSQQHSLRGTVRSDLKTVPAQTRTSKQILADNTSKGESHPDKLHTSWMQGQDCQDDIDFDVDWMMFEFCDRQISSQSVSSEDSDSSSDTHGDAVENDGVEQLADLFFIE